MSANSGVFQRIFSLRLNRGLKSRRYGDAKYDCPRQNSACSVRSLFVSVIFMGFKFICASWCRINIVERRQNGEHKLLVFPLKRKFENSDSLFLTVFQIFLKVLLFWVGWNVRPNRCSIWRSGDEEELKIYNRCRESFSISFRITITKSDKSLSPHTVS